MAPLVELCFGVNPARGPRGRSGCSAGTQKPQRCHLIFSYREATALWGHEVGAIQHSRTTSLLLLIARHPQLSASTEAEIGTYSTQVTFREHTSLCGLRNVFSSGYGRFCAPIALANSDKVQQARILFRSSGPRIREPVAPLF